ncbi:MAG: TolC family protein [Limnobacter sp.]|uniref:efflux transporter outer membrane subunit n=1 Tax=Limnobacter sp. TaxID=2003368 RepID=UPI0022C7E97F|nr:TolC family protein [Limnobacter sp.]MCZ8014442.1 TolC family protein [Limnobacter sp.]
MRTFRNILALAITLSLGACATQQPTSTLAVGDRFFADPSASQGISTDWWTRYADPELNTLIQNALTNNHDIKLAVARVMEARAGLDAAFTRLLPTLSINGGQSEQRTTLPDPFKQRGSPDVKATRIGAELSWEVDLFGATRASQRAFEQNGMAAESAVHGARLLVSSEVAKQWFLLKSAKQQVALLASAIESLQKQRELIQLRREMGLSSQFDLDRVDAELNLLIGQRPALAALEASLQARLAVLSGRSPLSGMSNTPAIQTNNWPTIAAVLPGQPIELLARRPDLVAAEHQLAAEGERLLEARRNFLPKVFINVLGGTQNLLINGLTQNGIDFRQSAAIFSLPVFNAGRLSALEDAQSARQQQFLLQYEKSVLTAMEEVEVSLVLHAGQRDTLQSRTRALAASASSLGHGQTLRQHGQIDQIQLEMLTRAHLQAQQQHLNAQLDTVLADIQLHKALGGGWQAQADSRPLSSLITAIGETTK